MKKTLLIIGLACSLALAPLVMLPVSAQIKEGIDAVATDDLKNKTISSPGGLIATIGNILLWLVGILSVIFLIWGGIRYITSAGDANKVTAAKNTIVYAIVGLVVAIFAYALVNFVIANVGGN